ncbi:MAG: hypothetical protein PHN88_09155 [Ignavibacteria bacterium]|nr:hypothetical protein [Ignavibacteria bacterium]
MNNLTKEQREELSSIAKQIHELAGDEIINYTFPFAGYNYTAKGVLENEPVGADAYKFNIVKIINNYKAPIKRYSFVERIRILFRGK